MFVRPILIAFIAVLFIFPWTAQSITIVELSGQIDSDADGLTDKEESEIYRTDYLHPDTDADGYMDGSEVKYVFDPNKRAPDDRITKRIEVNLQNQDLAYYLGPYLIKIFKVSTGVRRTPTPKGNFEILDKKPVHFYRGSNYYFPNTRWNMKFKPSAAGNFYIHGAYWHNKFGTPMSHGCVNVAYADMEGLYNWADIGTKVHIE